MGSNTAYSGDGTKGKEHARGEVGLNPEAWEVMPRVELLSWRESETFEEFLGGQWYEEVALETVERGREGEMGCRVRAGGCEAGPCADFPLEIFLCQLLAWK